MTDFSPLAHQCMVRPRWRLMQQAYEDYRQDGRPCKTRMDGRPIENQCAVRMSIALERCGFSLAGFGRIQDRNNPRRVHRRRRTCQLDLPHVLSADELHRYLDAAIGFTLDFRGRALSGAADAIRGQRGIIYFNNCFTRRGQTERRGDHIDLWDGTETYNQKLWGTGTREGADSRMFANADRIKFMPLL